MIIRLQATVYAHVDRDDKVLEHYQECEVSGYADAMEAITSSEDVKVTVEEVQRGQVPPDATIADWTRK